VPDPDEPELLPVPPELLPVPPELLPVPPELLPGPVLLPIPLDPELPELPAPELPLEPLPVPPTPESLRLVRLNEPLREFVPPELPDPMEPLELPEPSEPLELLPVPPELLPLAPELLLPLLPGVEPVPPLPLEPAVWAMACEANNPAAANNTTNRFIDFVSPCFMPGVASGIRLSSGAPLGDPLASDP